MRRQAPPMRTRETSPRMGPARDQSFLGGYQMTSRKCALAAAIGGFALVLHGARRKLVALLWWEPAGFFGSA